MPVVSPHLAGPWVAVLSDRLGFVYPNAQVALDALGPNTLVDVAIVRRSALPFDESGIGDGLKRRRPVFAVSDVAYELPALLAEGDSGVSAAARYEQAQAMTEGLNSVGHFECECLVCRQRRADSGEQVAPQIQRVPPVGDVR